MTQTTQYVSRYIVGIDLGTTNTAVSYVDTNAGREVSQLPIPQLVSAGEIADPDVLPSFCYLPGEHELPEGALELPWNRHARHAVGTFAREQGAAVPGRLVTSAKSWLAHGGVDRTSGILPWGGDLGEEAVSPVEVSRYFLEHIREAWDARFGRTLDEDGTPCTLAEQTVVLTVPASFDEAARELTVRAAQEAGFDHLVLLEEPLAAFYDWLRRHEDQWQQHLREGDSVLVIDIGGGTTDFSMVEIEPGFSLRRTAVGEHLLLGGDNIDMSLVREAEKAWNARLHMREWSVLRQQCRRAKERLLAPDGPEEVRIGITGLGSSVVAAARTHVVRREQLLSILLNGFFPVIERTAEPPGRRTGMREMGLPFVSDPAVTRHLLAFLRQASGGAVGDTGCDPATPSRVLFNGGTLLPRVLRERVAAVLGSWAGRDEPVPEIPAQDLNLAVSRGGAYYGLVRRGDGVRVRGGIARAYYAEVQSGGGTQLICVMPRDTEEGSTVEVSGHQFQLAANQPVRFPLYSSSTRLHDKAGEVLQDREELSALPPLQTVLTYGRRGQHRLLDVRVGSVLNEIGTLDIWCATSDGHRYPLSFDLRAQTDDAPAAGPEIVVAAHTLEEARERLSQAFGRADRLSGLTREMEEILGLARREWTASLLRALGDTLLADPDWRLQTPQHEARWLNVVGFCLRPGFGAPGDEWRLRQMWKIWHAGPSTRTRSQVVAEWWTCWRRVAGGLRGGHHQQIAGALVSDLVPKPGAKLGPRKGGPQEAAEMWRCLGALERLSAKTKRRALEALLTSPAKLQDHHWWVVARLGARRLLYGPANAVVAALSISPLIPRLLERAGRSKSRSALLAVAATSRVCGVRNLDLPDKVRGKALAVLEAADAPEEWRQQVMELREDSLSYQGEVAGDALPLGLTLVGGDEGQSE